MHYCIASLLVHGIIVALVLFVLHCNRRIYDDDDDVQVVGLHQLSVCLLFFISNK